MYGRGNYENAFRDYYFSVRFVIVSILPLSITSNMFGVPYPVFTRAPLVGSLDMDYWCSAFGTKGARVNT